MPYVTFPTGYALDPTVDAQRHAELPVLGDKEALDENKGNVIISDYIISEF